jgi:hypothetical protein
LPTYASSIEQEGALAQNQANTTIHTTPPVAPTATYQGTARPGLSVDGRYVVLLRVVLKHLPPTLQQQIVQAHAEMHHGTAGYPWPPAYRVVAVRWRPIRELEYDRLAP